MGRFMIENRRGNGTPYPVWTGRAWSSDLADARTYHNWSHATAVAAILCRRGYRYAAPQLTPNAMFEDSTTSTIELVPLRPASFYSVRAMQWARAATGGALDGGHLEEIAHWFQAAINDARSTTELNAPVELEPYACENCETAPATHGLLCESCAEGEQP
jgi:hypothetical protein